MIYKGIRFRKAPHICWRDGEPGDVDGDGRPIESNYAVFVDSRDCEPSYTEFWEDRHGNFRTRLYVTTKGVKPRPYLKIWGHSRTNMAYGMKKKARRHPWDKETSEYRPVFMVYDNICYVGRIWCKPEQD